MPNQISEIEITKFLTNAIQMQAEVLHLQPGNFPYIRRSGVLQAIEQDGVVSVELLDAIMRSVATASQIEYLERDKSISFSSTLTNGQRVRVDIRAEKGRYDVSLRFLPLRLFTLEELAIPPPVMDVLGRGWGWIILSGPFDSGRSTVWGALIEHINQHSAKRIVTLEQPIEYVFTSKKSFIEQREVGRDIGSMRQGLRQLIDSDVDVVGLSDCADSEVLDQVMALAANKKLVITISTAQSVVDTFQRIDALIPSGQKETMRANLAHTLDVVVSQRLLPRLGGGRALIAEVYRQVSLSLGAIAEGNFTQLTSCMQTSFSQGLCTLERALADAVKRGEITAEHALAESEQPDQLKSLLR